MKEIFVLPGVMLILIGFSSQLFDLAEAASEKSLSFTGEMVDAIDCAAEARPLLECSPGLYSYSWDEELVELDRISAELSAKEGIEKEHNKTIGMTSDD